MGGRERFPMESDMTQSHCRAKYSGSRMAWRQEDELEAARMIPGKSESPGGHKPGVAATGMLRSGGAEGS